MRLCVLAMVLGAVALAGCGADSGSVNGFEELYGQGLTKYVGMFEPTNEPEAIEGAAHTTLLRETAEGGSDPGVEIGSLETEINGVKVLDWFTAMIDGTETWDDLVDEGLE